MLHGRRYRAESQLLLNTLRRIPEVWQHIRAAGWVVRYALCSASPALENVSINETMLSCDIAAAAMAAHALPTKLPTVPTDSASASAAAEAQASKIGRLSTSAVTRWPILFASLFMGAHQAAEALLANSPAWTAFLNTLMPPHGVVDLRVYLPAHSGNLTTGITTSINASSNVHMDTVYSPAAATAPAVAGAANVINITSPINSARAETGVVGNSATFLVTDTAAMATEAAAKEAAVSANPGLEFSRAAQKCTDTSECPLHGSRQRADTQLLLNSLRRVVTATNAGGWNQIRRDPGVLGRALCSSNHTARLGFPVPLGDADSLCVKPSPETPLAPDELELLTPALDIADARGASLTLRVHTAFHRAMTTSSLWLPFLRAFLRDELAVIYPDPRLPQLTQQTPEPMLELQDTLHIPGSIAGRVIGIGGHAIRALEAEYGVRIMLLGEKIEQTMENSSLVLDGTGQPIPHWWSQGWKEDVARLAIRPLPPVVRATEVVPMAGKGANVNVHESAIGMMHLASVLQAIKMALLQRLRRANATLHDMQNTTRLWDTQQQRFRHHYFLDIHVPTEDEKELRRAQRLRSRHACARGKGLATAGRERRCSNGAVSAPVVFADNKRRNCSHGKRPAHQMSRTAWRREVLA